jgi:WD40 repeat protein
MTIDEALLVLDRLLGSDRLTHIQEMVFRQAWEGSTYPQIARATGYDDDYVKGVGAQLWQLLSEQLGRPVTKTNFQVALRQWRAEQSIAPHPQPLNPAQDWGESIEVTHFCGRQAELSDLDRWMTQEHCRVVSILGMGGMGKTALSVRLAEQVQGQFELLIWRSLRNAPPIDAILADLIQFLSQQQETELPETVDGKLSRLMYYLRSSRCLVILDNVESILGSGDSSGYYPDGYESYGQLFQRVAETVHQSCLVITSREQPREVAALESAIVRCLHLKGLDPSETQALLQPRQLMGSDASLVQLNQRYGGNPLALKMAAATMEELFDRNVALFLEQGTAVFGDISRLIAEQFDRLSPLEQQVMYWLAINRQPMTLTELADDLVPAVPRRHLIDALATLARRPIVEKQRSRFTQQPVVMEYVSDRLIDQVFQELQTGNLNLLTHHALLKATVEDDVRESQKRMIVQPLIERLQAVAPFDVDRKLQQVLPQLRQIPGYGAGNVLNLLYYLQVDLTGYDFSQLAVWQAYLPGAKLHQVNFAKADLRKSVFLDTLGNVWSVTYSLDGSAIAACDTSGSVHVWRVADGQKLVTCQGHDHWACSLAFGEGWLVSGSADTTVKRWDLATGHCVQTLQGHSDWVISVCANARLIASSSSDRTIRLWDLDTGACTQVLSGHRHWVCAIALHGERLVSGSDDCTVKLWDISSGTCLKTLEGHASAIRSIAFSPDGRSLASGSEDETIKLWDTETGRCLRTFSGHTAEVRGVSFSPDGLLLGSASYDRTVKLWDVKTGRCLKTMDQHSGPVRSLSFSPDGESLVSGSADQSVRIWSRSGECRKTLQGYTNFIVSVAFSPDEQLLVSSSTDHTVSLWSVATGECLIRMQGHTNWVWSVAFSPDGHTIASGSTDHTVRLWRRDGTRLKVLRGHTNWVWSVAFSPDGQMLATGSFDQTIRLWDGQSYECLRILTAHSRIWSVAFSPDGQLLASGEEDHSIHLWNPATGQILQTLLGHQQRVACVAFSPDGRQLISASEDCTLKLWDLKTGTCVQTFVDRDRLAAVAFCADGQSVVSCGIDRSLRRWNLRGDCEQELQGHGDRLWSVDCSANGNWIASGSEDETIRLWDSAGNCVRVLRSPRPYDGMNIADVTGITDAQQETLKKLGAIVK